MKTRDPYPNARATYNGTAGRVLRMNGAKNLWWRADGMPETNEGHMFSLRADGQWRAFGLPADGPGLIVLAFRVPTADSHYIPNKPAPIRKLAVKQAAKVPVELPVPETKAKEIVPLRPFEKIQSKGLHS
jgi:hypothetical protein